MNDKNKRDDPPQDVSQITLPFPETPPTPTDVKAVLEALHRDIKNRLCKEEQERLARQERERRGW